MALTGSYRSRRLYVLIWRMFRRVFRVTSVYQNISYCIKAASADLFPAEKAVFKIAIEEYILSLRLLYNL